MSNVKQKRHPRRPDQEWLDLIQECRSSGMTDKAWCEMNHIQPSKFYYHIRRLRKKACDIPANSKSASLEHHEIVKLQFDDPAVPVHDQSVQNPSNPSPDSSPAIRLNFRGCCIEVLNSAANGTIVNTLAALQSLC